MCSTRQFEEALYFKCFVALTIKVFTSIYKKTQSKESFFSLDELRLNISWKLIFIQILTIGCSRVWESSNLQTWKAQVWKGKRTWNVLHHSLHGYLQVFVYRPYVCLSKCPSICFIYIHLEYSGLEGQKGLNVLHYSLYGYLQVLLYISMCLSIQSSIYPCVYL